MNAIETILLVFVIIIVVATFFTEPKLSYEYYKAAAKSGFKMINGVIKYFKGGKSGAQSDKVVNASFEDVEG